MKSSSKIFLVTLSLIIIVIALDFTKTTTLAQRVGFIAAVGFLTIAFQKIGGYYVKNPLKAPRFIRRQLLDEEVLKNLQNVEAGAISLEYKVDTLRETLERLAINNALDYNPDIIAKIGDDIIRSASRMDTSLASPVVKKGGDEIDQA